MTSIVPQANGVVAVPLAIESERKLVRTVTYSPANEQCNANLKRIRHAKDMWATEFRRSQWDYPTEYDIRYYYKDWAAPRCPVGGTYTLGDIRHWPRCNIPDHVLEEPR